MFPAATDFPFPYYETFDHYGDAEVVGLPAALHPPTSTADLKSPAGRTGRKMPASGGGPGRRQSWAPGMGCPTPSSGDQNWKNYEVSRRMFVSTKADGRGCWGASTTPAAAMAAIPKATICGWMRTAIAPCMPPPRPKTANPGRQLATGQAGEIGTNQWHNLKLQFSRHQHHGFC